MNISVVIADSNREYVERLSEVMQQYDELTIHIYTTGEKFQTAMEKNHFDIVLFDPDISNENLEFPGVKLPVCLYSDEAHNTSKYVNFVKIAKYQKISTIYKQMISKYAEKAGYSADFDYSQNTVIAAVYSPIGGCGKTTVALGLASQLANQGKSTLFISIEQLSSSFYVNPRKEDGIVALVEAMTEKNMNFELKMKSLIKQGINGMHYIEGFERLSDYDAVTDTEAEELLNKIRRCGIYDVVIIDMGSSLDSLGKIIIKLADHVIIVEKGGELPSVKMELFAGQAFVNEHKNKMVKVCNFVESNSTKYNSELDIPIVGKIHNYGNLQLKNIIHAINTNGEILPEKIIKK